MVELRYGPDGTAFRLSRDGGVVDDAGRIPFHGIVSRGLVEQMRDASKGLTDWDACGHLLHEPAAPATEALLRWQRAAAACGVLSFAQSAACVRRYLEERETSAGGRWQAWHVKEGHTSSVWRVRHEVGDAEYALNVARDSVASRELARTSETMRRIAESWPEANLASVFDVAAVQPPGMDGAVVVTRNQWIADSHEIHRLPPRGDEPGTLVLLHRFLVDEVAPARVRRVMARRLAPDERARVEADLAHFLERTAPWSVQVDINDGDLVWNGRGAVVVAIR